MWLQAQPDNQLFVISIAQRVKIIFEERVKVPYINRECKYFCVNGYDNSLQRYIIRFKSIWKNN